MFISKTQLIIGIVTSGTFSAIVIFFLEWLKDWWIENKNIEKEQENQFYKQLRFYLKLFNLTKKTREELWDDREKSFKEKTENVQDSRQKGELLTQNLMDSRKFTSKLINQNWIYIEEIKKLLEQNPKYIREKDWLLVEKFLKAYLLREVVVGKESELDTINLFTDGKITQAMKSLFEVLDEMLLKI